MRVMHLLESGGLYGAESVVLNLSREMAKSGVYTPAIACIVQNASEAVALYDKVSSLGMEAHKVVINNKRFLFDIISFILWFRRQRIDLLHTHGYKASIIGFLITVFLRSPVLPTCHLWFWGDECRFSFRALTTIEIFLYRFFPVITVVSEPIKEYLVRKGVRQERIHIINNGVILEDFERLPENRCAQIRQGLGIGLSTSVIINVGRLTEQKAHTNLIQAARSLKTEGLDVVVLIVGDGELRSELERQVTQLDLVSEVRLLGFRDDAPVLLQIAQAFVMPSLEEGMPMALLETMASRVPAIATPVGDVPKLLDKGRCGVEIPVDDVEAIVTAVKRVLMSADGGRSMADAAYTTIQDKHSGETMFAAYRKQYMLLACSTRR